MKNATRDKKGNAKVRRAKKRLVVPPPESEVWPEQYRGKRWKSIFGILFAGRCLLCRYSCQQPKSRRLRDKWLGEDSPPLCMNYPDHPGELVEVRPTGTCRNFKIKHWTRHRPRPVKNLPSPPPDESDPQVRRIPVGKERFAIVDAADYEELSRYKWYASRHGRNTYAFCYRKGRPVYMHRMIMRARKGQMVDHIDGNGLNNWRDNLRFCTPGQNQANKKPRGGSSRYVGVCRVRGKWQAGINYRGKYFYLGLFDDEIEAAKVRDRKAYELHGPYAHLNFPEDFQC